MITNCSMNIINNPGWTFLCLYEIKVTLTFEPVGCHALMKTHIYNLNVSKNLAAVWQQLEQDLQVLLQAKRSMDRRIAFATVTTSNHQRVTWPGLYRKLIEFLLTVVWHMIVSTRLLEVIWWECEWWTFTIINYVSEEAHVVQLIIIGFSMYKLW